MEFVINQQANSVSGYDLSEYHKNITYSVFKLGNSINSGINLNI